MSFNCSKCFKTFPSKYSYWGHKNKCKFIDKERITLNINFENEPQIELDEYQNIELDDYQHINEQNDRGDLEFEVENKYYLYQKNFFKNIDLGKSNPVKTLSGHYAKGDKTIYLKLLDYIVSCHVSQTVTPIIYFCVLKNYPPKMERKFPFH